MSKPLIFISHVTEEAALAAILKESIDQDFLGMVEVFASSDKQSIGLGQKWLDNISAGLVNAKAMLVLCSPWSITRPWINFESGAGWVKGIPVIPICHSGMTPIKLPTPLNMLQAFLASEQGKLKNLYEVVAKELGSKAPNSDFSSMHSKILEFEKDYKLEYEVINQMKSIIAREPQMIEIMKKITPGVRSPIGQFPQILFENIKESLSDLRSKNLLEYNFNVVGMAFGGNLGTYGDLTLIVSHDLANILKTRF